ncbi:hypothetical protein VIGAN_05035200, partial [Vigna angularis var. angularis]
MTGYVENRIGVGAVTSEEPLQRTYRDSRELILLNYLQPYCHCIWLREAQIIPSMRHTCTLHSIAIQRMSDVQIRMTKHRR